VPGRLVPLEVQLDDLVGQVQHQVAIAVVPRDAQLDRIHLGHQVVAEGTVEAQQRISR
jgi:hypothetical protein